MKFLSLCAAALFLSLLSCLTIPSPTLAATCRDITTVKNSAVATANTAAGGHVTQHIYGMQPPPGTSQVDKTLFEAQGKYDSAWRQYKYVTNPVNCGASGQAQQSVSLQNLGMGNLGAYSCQKADIKGKCITWDSYMANSVFFGFIQKNGKWILNTVFPEPQT
ncbi:hypothetical protein [Moorena sp. SIO4G3]|uniref:hypothetical protein n=1 Tax=Moorena sp. SIO4G3 TaxID=2607821 RepID=UPI00142C220A|nr:hypothetical protein [Moorena sp. SIO4G3]NEO75496.1 hypothetical protein [Moorena sp. SIO4G3]